MALVAQANRLKLRNGLMKHWSELRETVEATKPEIYNPANDTGIIADLDSWLDIRTGNTAPDTVGVNGAINSSYRSKFTSDQKAKVVAALAGARVSMAFVAGMLDVS